MLNKLVIVNTFVFQTLPRYIMHSAIRTLKTTEKMDILKCGGGGGSRKERLFSSSPLSNYRVLCLFYVLLRLNA